MRIVLNRLLTALLGGAAFVLTAHCAPSTPEEGVSGTDALSEGTSSTAVCTEETKCSTTKRRSPSNACVFVVAFDGSGLYSPNENSNVAQLYKATAGPAAIGGERGLNGEVVSRDTTRVYIEGVPPVVVGASAERVDRGRSAVCQHLAKRETPCDIVLLGYSRGAIIANQVAHVMNELGCEDGAHKGQPVAFLGMFDPVWTLMGNEWTDGPTHTTYRWQGSVPSNVENVLQAFKDPKQDPRGGVEAMTLTTTLLDTTSANSACDKAFTSKNHPDKKAWHHGEIGHFELPRDAMKCALAQAGIAIDQER